VQIGPAQVEVDQQNGVLRQLRQADGEVGGDDGLPVRHARTGDAERGAAAGVKPLQHAGPENAEDVGHLK